MFVIRMKENVEIFRPHSLKRIEQAGSPVTRDSLVNWVLNNLVLRNVIECYFLRMITATRCVLSPI